MHDALTAQLFADGITLTAEERALLTDLDS